MVLVLRLKNECGSFIHFLSSSCATGIRARKIKCRPCLQRRNLRKTSKRPPKFCKEICTQCCEMNEESLHGESHASVHS